MLTLPLTKQAPPFLNPSGRQPRPRLPLASAGAGEGTRTPDPLITNQMLYQLSYASHPKPSNYGGMGDRIATGIFPLLLGARVGCRRATRAHGLGGASTTGVPVRIIAKTALTRHRVSYILRRNPKAIMNFVIQSAAKLLDNRAVAWPKRNATKF